MILPDVSLPRQINLLKYEHQILLNFISSPLVGVIEFWMRKTFQIHQLWEINLYRYLISSFIQILNINDC